MASYAATVLADNPAAYWRLGEASGTAAADQEGSNPGTYQGGVTLARPGLLTGDADTAVLFNGTNSYVQVPWAAALNTPQWSVETVVSVSGGQGSYRAAVSTRQGATYGWALYASGNGKWEVYVYAGTGSTLILTGTVIAVGTRTFLLATHDGTTASLYVNGSLAASRSVGFAANPSAPFRIGAGANEATPPNYYFPGTIDDTAVYNYALTAGQVSAHYQAGTTAPVSDLHATATIPGAGALAAAPTLVSVPAAALTGTGALQAAGVLVDPAQAALAAAGGLQAGALIVLPAEATVAGQGALQAGGTVEDAAHAAIQAAGDLSATATVGDSPGVQITAGGHLQANGQVYDVAFAALTGEGEMRATAVLDQLAAAQTDGAGALAAAPLIEALAGLAIDGHGLLVAQPTVIAPTPPPTLHGLLTARAIEQAASAADHPDPATAREITGPGYATALEPNATALEVT